MKDIRYWGAKVLSPEQAVEKRPEPKYFLKERLQYEQAESKRNRSRKYHSTKSRIWNPNRHLPFSYFPKRSL